MSAKASGGPATEPIGVFVLDDQEIVRRGVGLPGDPVAPAWCSLPDVHRVQRRQGALIGEGLTNRQIGERLFIAEKTVKTYVSTLFRKLGLQQRTAAAAYAARVFNGPALEPRQRTWIIDRTPGPDMASDTKAG